MKNLKLQIGVIVTALAVAVSAQSPRPAEKTSAATTVVPTIATAAPVTTNTSATSTSAFATAATANSTFRNDLTWTFGGKQQRGWYLYDRLIGKTLDTLNEPGTNDFAASIAAWQKRRGIT